MFPAAIAAVLLLGASAATRLALAIRTDGSPLDGLTLLGVFSLGAVYDVTVAALAVAPLVLWLGLASDRLARSAIYRGATLVWVYLWAYAALLLCAAEWLFWEEFGSRFNFIAVDYLLYTHEVLGNIWESYPVGRVLVGIALLAATVTVAVARPVWRSAGAAADLRPRFAAMMLYLAAAAGFAWTVNSEFKGRFSSDAASELAGNGVFEFFAANRRSELSYDRHYVTIPLPDAMATVREALGPAEWVGPDAKGTERRAPGRVPEKRLNVVLVSVESLGSEYVGAQGDTRGLTPNLDRLAREGLWFTNVYATGNRTVRGLEALALALPPTPGQSIVRRPNNEDLFSIGSVFEDKGYSVLFAYGGYGYFDNMNAFFGANNYRVVDRTGIPSARVQFANIWGVADEYLFEQVIEEIDRDKAARPDRPVFVHVLTTSNHRPYTYPGGRIDIPSGSGRDGAVKYTDYAVGRLIEGARGRPWFDDTLFVITADHGANARGTSRIPVDRYRIPLIVYSPRHVAPARVDRLMSQIDIAPTVLGLLDFDYYNKFFGRDLLRSPAEGDRAFVGNFQTLGYLRGGVYVVLQPKRKVDTFHIDTQARIGARAIDPQAEREAIAFYQTASHVFRSGLYRDEEQIPPAERGARALGTAAMRLAR